MADPSLYFTIEDGPFGPTDYRTSITQLKLSTNIKLIMWKWWQVGKLGYDINSLRTDFVDRLFSQNTKLRKPANVVNPYYAQTTRAVSKGPTLFLRHQKTYLSTIPINLNICCVFRVVLEFHECCGLARKTDTMSLWWIFLDPVWKIYLISVDVNLAWKLF